MWKLNVFGLQTNVFLFCGKNFANVPPKKLPYNTFDHIKNNLSHWSCQDFSYWGWMQ